MTPSEQSGSGPIKLPLKPGEAIWFDFIAGKVYVAPIVGGGRS